MYRIILALVLTGCVETAVACYCAPLPAKTAYAKSAVVFLGTVNDFAAGERVRGIEAIRIDFTIEKIWKADREQIGEVYTDPDSGGCGVPFKLGSKYIVFAWSSKLYEEDSPWVLDSLFTTECLGTIELHPDSPHEQRRATETLNWLESHHDSRNSGGT